MEGNVRNFNKVKTLICFNFVIFLFSNKYIHQYYMNPPTIKQFIFVSGIFLDNNITTENESISCITYGIVRQRIQGMKGYFALRWDTDYECYVVYEWVEID